MNKGFWSDKKVFVTGHTGFKGAWLSHWLHQLGAEVCGYALTPPTSPSIFSETDLASLIESHIADITDTDRLNAVMSDFAPDIVIHMAAQSLVLASYDDPVGTYMTNVIGTANVFEAVRKTPSVKTIVNVTTDKCYENKEWYWGYRENEAMGGHDPYSSSKGCAELLTASYQKSFFEKAGINLASVRAGNVIGGGDWAENRLVPDIIRAMLLNQAVVIRNPNAIRPWQHVLEPISGYLQLAEKLHSDDGSTYANAWNFGPSDDDAQPVDQIVTRLCDRWGDGASWELEDASKEFPHEATYLKLDCSKAKAELDWSPQLRLGDTLDWIVEWYKSYQSGKDMKAVTNEQIERYQSLMESS